MNIEAIKPTMSVTAKPFIGPVPNWKRNSPEIIVVKLESRIVINAFEKPFAIAVTTVFPSLSSSLILS